MISLAQLSGSKYLTSYPSTTPRDVAFTRLHAPAFRRRQRFEARDNVATRVVREPEPGPPEPVRRTRRNLTTRPRGGGVLRRVSGWHPARTDGPVQRNVTEPASSERLCSQMAEGRSE